MSVFKIEKNDNYTVMSNYHLRDRNLSYKAKGLLSFMLSLPADWDYSMSGLEAISKESIKAIRNILQELEDNKYLVRTRMQDELGKFYYDYSIYEMPFDIDPHYQKGHAVKGQTEKGIQINTNNKIDKEIKTSNEDKFNFLLEGDNLHSLYLLEKTHRNRVDVIYIDPPYNTKNNDFVYNDEMISAEDGYRHSKWLSFMGKRLEIAKNLLSNKGIIFISIDDNEYSQLKLLCDDIFGENNYVSTLHWKKKKQPSYLHGQVAGVMEYILIYSNNRNLLDKLSLSTPSDSNTRVDNANNQVSIRNISKGIKTKLPSDVHIIKVGIYKNKKVNLFYLQIHFFCFKTKVKYLEI